MTPKSRFRIFPWRSRGEIARDVDSELAFHLDMRILELVAQGMERAEATTTARAEFGDIEFTRNYCRQVDEAADRSTRTTDRIGEWRQDIRYAFRTLRRSPAFTAVAILTLALAIGANTAIFSVARAVLLRPLPYGDPASIVSIVGHPPLDNRTIWEISAPDFAEYQKLQRSFSGIAAYYRRSITLQPAQGDPALLIAMPVTANFFEVLRVSAWRGRTFAKGDDAPGAANTVILSYGLWRSSFGADSAIIGQKIRLSNDSYTVIGVMPQGFAVRNETIWLPNDLSDDLARAAVTRKQHILGLVARLKPGVSVASANADVRAMTARLAAEYPDIDGTAVVTAQPLHSTMAPGLRQPVLLLLGAAGIVLLIACANLANLTLSRTMSRRAEFAVRAALGAGRLRIARQLLTESIILSLAGGTMGIIIAVIGTRALLALNPGMLPTIFAVGFDSRVLLFSLGISVLTGVLFGTAPALGATREDLHSALKEKGRGGSASRAGEGLRRGLVVAQVALAVMLLVGAGLLIRSFTELTQVHLGFDPDHVLTAQIRVDGARYDSTAAVNQFYDGVIREISQAPGVIAVGAMMQLPTEGRQGSGIYVAGTTPDAAHTLDIGYSMIRSDALGALKIPIVAGRALNESDEPGGPKVALVNQAAARAYFPNGEAVGRQVRVGPNSASPFTTIVGVVADLRDAAVDTPTGPMFYDNARQQTWWHTLTLVVRTQGDPQSAVALVRQAVKRADATAAVHNIKTMHEAVGSSMSVRRFALGLTTSFAILALLLAAVGIYGVLAFLVTSRTREFGVRLALGASTRNVLILVVRQGMTWSLIGAAVGIGAAIAGGRLLAGMLYGVGPVDVATYAAVLTGVIAVVGVACVVPAVRAMRVDPITSMRAE